MNEGLRIRLEETRVLLSLSLVAPGTAGGRTVSDRWVRSGASGSSHAGGSDPTSEARALELARSFDIVAGADRAVDAMLTAETDVELAVVVPRGATDLAVLSFRPSTPLGLVRLIVARARPWLEEGANAASPPSVKPIEPVVAPSGPPITASYEGAPSPATDDEDVRPGLPPPTQPPGPVGDPRPEPPRETQTPGDTGPPAPPLVAARQPQAAPTLTSPSQFQAASKTVARDAAAPPAAMRSDSAPPLLGPSGGAGPGSGGGGDSARFAGPPAGATRPTTTLSEASSEAAARGVRLLAYLDAHADDAHLALLRVSLQTGLSIETLRAPEALDEDALEFVAASVRRILGRPLEM